MRTKADMLQDLVRARGSLRELQEHLKCQEWHSDVALVTLRESDVAIVLKKYLEGEIPVTVIETWANALEMREDVDFESEMVKEIVFYCANPEIHEPVNREIAIAWIEKLNA